MERQWNPQVTCVGHLWPTAPTGLGCREQQDKGKAQGTCHRGNALCKCISICVPVHTDILREPHKGLTPWRVNNCKTWFVLRGRLHWELKVLSIVQVWTQRLLYLEHINIRKRSDKLCTVFDYKNPVLCSVILKSALNRSRIICTQNIWMPKTQAFHYCQTLIDQFACVFPDKRIQNYFSQNRYCSWYHGTNGEWSCDTS